MNSDDSFNHESDEEIELVKEYIDENENENENIQ
jgi:hypothetical protein